MCYFLFYFHRLIEMALIYRKKLHAFCLNSTVVVQLTCNEQVVGSNPTESSIKMIQNR